MVVVSPPAPLPEHASLGSLQLSVSAIAAMPAAMLSSWPSPSPLPPPSSPSTGAHAPLPSSPTGHQPPPSSPPPPLTGNTEVPPADLTSPPSPQAHSRSVVGIAAGSAAAAAAILLVLALVLYLVAAARRKRRTGPGNSRAAAGTDSPGSSQQHESAINIYPLTTTASPSPAGPRDPVKTKPQQHSVQLTPAPTAAASSSLTWTTTDASSLAPLAATASSGGSSNKSQKPDPPDGLLPAAQPVAVLGGGEILFRGALAYEELAAATNGFSDSNLLGRGGFGDVYVGAVDGAMVAVKRLRAGSQQGDREFQAELRIISRVHHRNLVSLVGYGVADGGQRLLVYEFVPNLTLHHHLHGKVEAVLDWSTRWKIAVGAAKGLAYLHEDCHPRIIHRDIKSANILLDDDFNPKVSDFGMAKFVPRGDTHIATRIVGTIGYLAPEYASSGRLTDKSDVFSYGVVLLEIITGMNVVISSDPDTEDTLVGWATPLLKQALEFRDYGELVDPLLASFDAVQMERLIRCAAAAVSASARRRPRMSQIVRRLEGDASAEEIEACGAMPSGRDSGSVYGDTSAHSYPVIYDEIRTSRREARVKKLHQS